MRRRTYLAALSSATIPVLAGCNGGEASGDSGSGVPYFEDVALSGPETGTVEDRITLEVSATNTGQRSGDFTNTLEWGLGSKHIQIEDIPPGKEKTSEIDATTVLYHGRYEFRILDYGAAHPVEIDPLQLSLGETYEPSTDHRLTTTVTDIRTEGAIAYDSGDRTRTWNSNSGEVFVIVRSTVQNQTDSEQHLDTGLRVGEHTQLLTYEAPFTVDSLNQLHIDGEPYAEHRRIQSGDSFSGWQLFEVPLDVTQDGVSAEYYNSSTGRADVIWS